MTGEQGIRKKYLGIKILTRKLFTRVTWFRGSGNISSTYYGYDDIPLKLFLEINISKEYDRICRSGKPDNCVERWEFIMQRNAEAVGNFEYEIYLQNSQIHGSLVHDYLYIKAALLRLYCKVDFKLIDELKKKGYKIDLSEGTELDVMNAKYALSILKALKRCDHLITKITVKKNEMQKSLGDKQEAAQSQGYDSAMALLSFHWPGSSLPEDITLSRYNECLRLIKTKNTKSKKDGSGFES